MDMLVFDDGCSWEEVVVTLGNGRTCLAWLYKQGGREELEEA
jgi:hypothetical protein